MPDRPPAPPPDDEQPTYRLMPPLEPRGRPSEPPAPPLHPLRRLLLGQLPLEAETSFFILANVMDFFVTYWLLMSGGVGNMRFVESNPVARYFIESWGPVKGMLGFKLSIVTFVCLLSQVIALKREDLGAKVLLFGTLATGFVVVYSVALYLRHA